MKTEFRKHCEFRPADKPVRLLGALSYVDLTEREEEREITDKPQAFAALRKALGIVKLIASLTITFKVLDAAIPTADQAKYVTRARTGSRDMSAGLLADAAIPEAIAA